MKRSALVAATFVVALMLAACAADKQADSTGKLALPSTAAAAPSTTAAPTSDRNARGNIVKAMGEEAGFLSRSDPSKDLLTFAVDSVTVDPPCTADYTQPTENGHFVALAMRLATSPDMAEEPDLSYFTVNPNDFSFVGADGLTVSNLATMAAYSCIDQGQMLTSNALAPGSQYAGTVVLDVPATTGVVIYHPMGNPSGWEWSF